MKLDVLERIDRWMLWAVSLTVITEIVLNFIGSYGHIYVLGGKYGEHGVDNRILPITIDGMLMALALVNVFAARFNRKSRWLRLGLAFGVAGTIAANAAYGAAWGITGGFLSVWAPIALFITVESALFMFRIVADLIKEAKDKEATPQPIQPDYAEAQRIYAEHMQGLAEIRAMRGETPPWETGSLPAVDTASEAAPAAEQAVKSQAPNTSAWEGLNGIGLSGNGARQ